MAREIARRIGVGAAAIAVATGLGLGLAACGGSGDSADVDPEAAQTVTDGEPVADPDDVGDIVVSYDAPEDPVNQDVAEFIESSNLYPELAEALNTQFALPTDLNVVFTEGDGPAYYSDDRAILYDWGFLTLAANTFAEQGDEGDALQKSLIEVSAFVFYHELGHALVDLYGLPITGKEEDAVDQLATVIAVWSEYPEMAIAGARLFDALSANQGDPEWSDFADEHSLDQQRVANIACWVYGSDPEGFGQQVQAAVQLPEARLARCEDEWDQIEKSWAQLLLPHFREGAEDAGDDAGSTTTG